MTEKEASPAADQPPPPGRERSCMAHTAICRGWSRRRWLALILIGGAVARVAAAVYLGDRVVPVSGAYDQVFYHDLALNLLAGKGFVFTRPPWPFIQPGAPTAYYSFVYPMFLAAIYFVAGPHALAARIVQALICSMLPYQVYSLTKLILLAPSPRRRAGGGGWQTSPATETIALVAAAITALYAYFVLYAASLQSEGVYLVLVAWALILTLKLADRPTWQRWLAWALAVTLAAEVRQVFMPIALVLFAYIVARAWRRIKVRHVALGGVVAVALILPFTFHNYRVYGRFLLLNSSFGQVFWNANHPALGVRFVPDAMFAIPADLEGANEAVLTNELLRRGLQIVADDPVRFIRLSLSRAEVMLAFWPMKGSSPASNIARPLSWGVCLPFMIAGLILSAGEWRRWLLLYLFAASYLLIHFVSWAQYRYRTPVDMVLIPFAAVALVALGERVSRIRRQAVGE